MSTTSPQLKTGPFHAPYPLLDWRTRTRLSHVLALTAGGSTTRWQTSKGEPTAGSYGFAREMMSILEQEKPEYLAVAFDTGKTFRDQIFPEYKGTRAKMPDDLSPQITRIRQLVDAFNIPRLELEGFEADDVLGSIAHIANQLGLGVKIITGDRDLLQLVNQRTMVYLAGDDQNYVRASRRAACEERQSPVL